MAGTYTDRDALKDHKRIINKTKERIKALKADIAKDQEMIKDKEEKIKTANDDKPKHAGMKSQKQMYADNIAKIKDRVKETQGIIKEVEAELKDRLQKHKEAEADVKRIEAKKSKKTESHVNEAEGENPKADALKKKRIALGDEAHNIGVKATNEYRKNGRTKLYYQLAMKRIQTEMKAVKMQQEWYKEVGGDSNSPAARMLKNRLSAYRDDLAELKSKLADAEKDHGEKQESAPKAKLANQLMSLIESLNANDELEKEPVGVLEDDENDDEEENDDINYEVDYEDEEGEMSDDEESEEPAATDDLTDLPDVEDNEDDEEEELNDSEEDEEDKEPVVLENDEETESEEETNEEDEESDSEENKNEEEQTGDYPEEEENLDKDQLQESVREFNSFNRGMKRILETKINEDEGSKKKKDAIKAKIVRAKELVKKLRDKMLTYEKNAKKIKAKKKGVRRTPEQIKKDKQWSSEVASQSSKMRAAWYKAKEYVTDFEDQLEAL